MVFPKLTQDLLQSMHAATDAYTVMVDGLPITVFPDIFPPESPFSKSSGTLAANAQMMKGKRVLDIGTGTGVQAILAAKEGATSVHAIDISSDAVACAQYNVDQNRMNDKVRVYLSDLFSRVKKQKFDIIIANLPIVEHQTEEMVQLSVFDPGFRYHERLFNEAPAYLSPGGCIVLCHADIESPDGFSKLETLAKKHGFRSKVTDEIKALGYTWRNYEFRQ